MFVRASQSWAAEVTPRSGEPALAHLEVDGKHAVAAPVVHTRPQAALTLGDGNGPLLEVVGPDLADQGLDLRGTQRRTWSVVAGGAVSVEPS